MRARYIFWGLVVAACAGAVVIAAPRRADAAGLPFIEDDYPRARAEALRRKQLLVVERWAPW